MKSSALSAVMIRSERNTSHQAFPELFAVAQTGPPPEKDAEEPPFVTIERDYKRVANAIELMWGSKELDVYLQKLMLDDRGGRAGFPERVLAAIIKLYDQHTAQFKFTKTGHGDTWSGDPLVQRFQKADRLFSFGGVTPPTLL